MLIIDAFPCANCEKIYMTATARISPIDGIEWRQKTALFLAPSHSSSMLFPRAVWLEIFRPGCPTCAHTLRRHILYHRHYHSICATCFMTFLYGIDAAMFSWLYQVSHMMATDQLKGLKPCRGLWYLPKGGFKQWIWTRNWHQNSIAFHFPLIWKFVNQLVTKTKWKITFLHYQSVL